MQYKVGIVGATGAVGQELIGLLLKREFPCEIRALASSRSAGKTITVGTTTLTIGETTAQAFDGLDIAVFAADSDTSRRFAPEAVKRGVLVIDNSSAFRMEDDVPLVVPEVNGDAARKHKGIIANPNCTGAVSIMGLFPLHKAFGLKRVFASSYQAASGAGAPAMAELEQQMRDWSEGKEMKAEAFAHQLAFNLIPHIDKFQDDGYTGEEIKMQKEMRKIMGLPELRISTTCVRVPVLRAHSVSINAEFERPVDVEEARRAIEAFPGVEVNDDPANNRYPMPFFYSQKEDCGVGRIRKDTAFDNGLAFWVVGDQLWKGAALNAVQIAELVVDRGWVKQQVPVS